MVKEKSTQSVISGESMGKLGSMRQSKFLSKEEAADYLGVSIRTIERLIARKEIPFYKFGDAKVSPIRISPTDLDKWAAKFRTEAVSA
jgi:excisionase family DNA binding protein